MTPGQEKRLAEKLADWTCDGQGELEVPTVEQEPLGEILGEGR